MDKFVKFGQMMLCESIPSDYRVLLYVILDCENRKADNKWKNTSLEYLIKKTGFGRHKVLKMCETLITLGLINKEKCSRYNSNDYVPNNYRIEAIVDGKTNLVFDKKKPRCMNGGRKKKITENSISTKIKKTEEIVNDEIKSTIRLCGKVNDSKTYFEFRGVLFERYNRYDDLIQSKNLSSELLKNVKIVMSEIDRLEHKYEKCG